MKKLLIAIVLFAFPSFAQADETTLTALQKTKKCVVQIENPSPAQWDACITAAKGASFGANQALMRVKTCDNARFLVRYLDKDGKPTTDKDLQGCNVMSKQVLLERLLGRAIAEQPEV